MNRWIFNPAELQIFSTNHLLHLNVVNIKLQQATNNPLYLLQPSLPTKHKKSIWLIFCLFNKSAKLNLSKEISVTKKVALLRKKSVVTTNFLLVIKKVGTGLFTLLSVPATNIVFIKTEYSFKIRSG